MADERTGENETAVIRLVALVRNYTGPRRTRHLLGQALMPIPDVVLLEEERHGAMLYRYAASGGFGGDTWHEDAEQARKQAVFEYGEVLGDWHPVPHSIEDAHRYAIEYSRKARQGG